MEIRMRQRGLLIVMSGPSGAGKGTICRELLNVLPGMSLSISATTRDPRPSEQHGKEYFFLTKEEFRTKIANEQFLEYAEYLDNYYGTPKDAVDQALLEGKDVILEIETKGASQVRKLVPHGVFVFIVPPSIDDLRERIRQRGAESEEKIEKRLAKASEELPYIDDYDYCVVNDNLADAVDKVKAIIIAEKCRVVRQV